MDMCRGGRFSVAGAVTTARSTPFRYSVNGATLPTPSQEADASGGTSEGDYVAVLLEVPLEDSAGLLLVEADRADIPGGLVLAAPQPGEAAAKAGKSLAESLERLEPVLRTVKDKLAASAPEAFEVKFGVKLGGETGIILAKGTAEVNFEITMKWNRGDQGS